MPLPSLASLYIFSLYTNKTAGLVQQHDKSRLRATYPYSLCGNSFYRSQSMKGFRCDIRSVGPNYSPANGVKNNLSKVGGIFQRLKYRASQEFFEVDSF